MITKNILRSNIARLLMASFLLTAVALVPHVALGAKPPSFTNVQVNQVFPGPFATNRTAEPSIAQNPTNSQNIIVGAIDEIANPPCSNTTPSVCQDVSGISVSGFYASFDGGKTFPCQGLIDLSAFNKWAEGDSWLTFDSRGNAYYGTLAFDNVTSAPGGFADIFVAKSMDGGCTWGTAAKVSGSSPAVYDDKDSIVADPNASSPFRDNLYAVWTKFTGGANQIMFTRSTDGGATWDNPQAISDGSFEKFKQAAVVQVGPTGTVYVVWRDTVNKQLVQRMAISYNGGKTFPQSNITVATVTDDLLDGDVPGTGNFSRGTFPSFAVAPDGALYVVWSNYTNGHAVVLLTKSTTGGLTWSSPVVAGNVSRRSAIFQALAVDPNGKVNVIFNALDDVQADTSPGASVVHYDTYWIQSTNGGATFGRPLKISTATSDPDGSSTHGLGDQFIGDYISTVADASHVYAVWTDSRNASPCVAVDAFRVETGPKPNVITQCPITFGNTDIFLGIVSP